jgi:hypothetical protein
MNDDMVYPTIDERVEILRKRYVPDWKIHWCGDAWTQFKDKIIHMMKFSAEEDTLQCFMHQVCHALRNKGGHGEDFWVELEALVLDALNRPLNEMQAKMKKDYMGNRA